MRRMMAGILGLWLAASPAFGASSPAEIQEEVFPKFDKGLEEMASRQNVDERSLMEKLTFRDPKFQRIIQDCFEIMAESSLGPAFPSGRSERRDLGKAGEDG